MKSFDCIITDAAGIHARPAGLLAKEVKKYDSDIEICFGDKKASAAKLLAVMALSVKQGDRVTVCVSGVDEDIATEAMKKFFADNF